LHIIFETVDLMGWITGFDKDSTILIKEYAKYYLF